MKSTLIAAAMIASFSASAFDAPEDTKAAWVAEVVERAQHLPIQEFCKMKGGFWAASEGTAPDSVERGMDYGMVGAHAMLSRHWTQEQRDECTKIEIEAYRDAQDSEDEE